MTKIFDVADIVDLGSFGPLMLIERIEENCWYDGPQNQWSEQWYCLSLKNGTITIFDLFYNDREKLVA